MAAEKPLGSACECTQAQGGLLMMLMLGSARMLQISLSYLGSPEQATGVESDSIDSLEATRLMSDHASGGAHLD